MLIFNGRRVPVPGVVVGSFMDDAQLRLGPGDRRARRGSWVHLVVVHTSWGVWPQVIHPGVGPDLRAERSMVEHWTADPDHSGAHLVIDTDGSVGCTADLVAETAFHATSVNDASVGIELKQSKTGDLWQVQLATLVKVVDVLTRELGIQRQMHHPYRGPQPRLLEGGDDCVGVIGHRDQTGRRGRGDPGDSAMEALAAAGYERWAFHSREDVATWRLRQRKLVTDFGEQLKVDGVPGPATCRVLEAHGRPHGLWVSRPGDRDTSQGG